jgi:hypothetical protein
MNSYQRDEGQHSVDGYAEPRFSIWCALGFGRAHVDTPEDEIGFAPGYLSTETTIFLDWKDRLRVLVSGRLHSSMKTQTDVFVEKAISRSSVRVLPPKWSGR